MSERRTGTMDVLIPITRHPNDRNASIRCQVRTALARNGEWPIRIEFRSGLVDSGSGRQERTVDIGPLTRQR
ncbi:hypothetical protein [Nocardia aurea]|uniref:hypothetical protein n=1 Tax=Nocardia aurea TaxID=2144174 RepID=UPI000D6998E4|nr:hypothetical protein [Nocardia aurea]